MAEETTNVEVKRDTWRELNARKRGPNDTFDDVIRRMLDETEG